MGVMHHGRKAQPTMITTLYRSAATWTAIGLASGLFYREFTKANDFTGWTQLSVVHTHALTLGTVVLLLFLALTAVLDLGADKRCRWGVGVWNVGLVLTTGMMTVKGMLQVLGNESANSPAIAGVSGLGHMTLTAAFILVFLALGTAVRRRAADTKALPNTDTVADDTAASAPVQR
jgi:hypothetical protein